jgi:AraC family transcriptional regulator
VRDGGRPEYDKRVNRVIDHIHGHLGEELSLGELADVAAFSPYHFHRVFKAITGETLFGFIQRVRIERAATALVLRSRRSVLETALDHGFSSPAAFARAFRARFGMSATEWRAGGAERWRRRKLGQQVRKAGKARTRARRNTPRRRTEEGAMHVVVRALPAFHVAYMRYVGPFGPHGIPELWTRLRQWMERRDLLDAEISLGVAHDDPDVTDPEKCRYDACVVVPADFTPDRWVNVTDLAGGKYAVSGFTGTAHDIRAAWDALYRSWLPDSGYEPDDRPCMELYRRDRMVDAKAGVFRCELCVPIRPV